jgi:rod shape-determining protein MreD
MNNKFIFTNSIRLVLLIALQVLLLNELPFGSAYLMIYPMAIMLLPVSSPRLVVLFLAFFTGLIIDIFSNGGGLHTASLTAVGYLRIYILDTFQPRSGWDKLDVPNLSQQGVNWFFYYSLIFFTIHHLIYFFLEVFSFANFFSTIIKTLFSLFGSLVIVWIISLFFLRNTRD